MANHFRETAGNLRSMTSAPRLLFEMTATERETLVRAAAVFCRLEQLKRDILASDPADEDEAERLSLELLSLLGLQAGS